MVAERTRRLNTRHVEVTGQLERVRSLLTPWSFWGPHSDCQVWPQVPSPAEPFCQPSFFLCEIELSLTLKLTHSVSLAGHPPQEVPFSHSAVIVVGIQMWPLYPGSDVGTKDLNSGPCACERSTLLTEPPLALILFLPLPILHNSTQTPCHCSRADGKVQLMPLLWGQSAFGHRMHQTGSESWCLGNTSF